MSQNVITGIHSPKSLVNATKVPLTVSKTHSSSNISCVLASAFFAAVLRSLE